MDLSGLTFTESGLTAKNAENTKGVVTSADGTIRGGCADLERLNMKPDDYRGSVIGGGKLSATSPHPSPPISLAERGSEALGLVEVWWIFSASV
jgi:hypothetical protein